MSRAAAVVVVGIGILGCGGGFEESARSEATGAIRGTVVLASEATARPELLSDGRDLPVRLGLPIDTDAPEEPGPLFVAGEVLIAAPTGVAEREVAERASVEGFSAPEILGVARRWWLARFRDRQGNVPDLTETARLARILDHRAGLAGAERNFVVQPAAIPDDPLFPRQWYLAELQLPKAWDLAQGSSGTVIAVLDTGLGLHPQLVGRTVQGRDFVLDAARALDGDGRDPDATDPGGDLPGGRSSFHGTRVAGVIASRTGDADGVAGIDWHARLQPVRVMGKGGGTLSDIAAGIEWASGGRVRGVPDNATPARVLNLSLGALLGSCPRIFQDVVDDALGRNAAIVVAAGNEGTDVARSAPANCRGVVSVAGVDRAGRLAPYSNRGSVSLAAYGGSVDHDLDRDGFPDGILTPAFGADGRAGYQLADGTSLAAPQVAGIASLMIAANPRLSGRDVRDRLLWGARRDTCSVGCGAGIVNALSAVKAARRDPRKALRIRIADVNLATNRSGMVVVENLGAVPVEAAIDAAVDSRVRIVGTERRQVGPKGQAEFPIVLDTTGLESGEHWYELTVEASGHRFSVRIAFTVVAASGAENRAVRVIAFQREGGRWMPRASTWTSLAEGRFRLPRLAAGSYALAAAVDEDGDGRAFEGGERQGSVLGVVVRAGEEADASMTLAGVR